MSSLERFVVCLALAAISCAKPPQAVPVQPPAPTPPPAATAKSRVIVLIWDGLRPDSIDPEITPELARLRDKQGVNFRNHHSVYPTFTMMNAAALATGVRSGIHGFYGNFEYQPGPTGKSAKGTDFDYDQPFFSEDHAVLQTLDAFYKAQGGALLRAPTLFELAHQSGLTTATLGKAGPAFLQDYRPDDTKSVLLDENVVLPRSFGLALKAAGLPLPKNTVNQAYSDGPIELAADNGDPTAAATPAVITLADGVTPDPRAAGGSAHKQRVAYMMRVFNEYILPKVDPELSMIWLRNPDSTEHGYGPGTPNVLDALRHQDQLLGELLRTLDKLGRTASTDLIVASDHGHSSIASDAKLFPLRGLKGEPDGKAGLGAVEDAGYVVSGDIRSAAWLRRAGFTHSYDGVGCVFDPVMAGVDAKGRVLHESHEEAACKPLPRVSTGDFRVPHGKLPGDAIIIAANGGSEYFYVPSHDPSLLKRLVRTLQERRMYGPLFVRGLYGEIPGTLPLARIGMEDAQSVSPPMPDVVASFEWDDTARSAAAPKTPGSEHSSAQGYRGMHGSFSPVDVHATLIATGPHFRAGFANEYPSSNLDLAATLAKLLGLTLPKAEGRVLTEAMSGGDAVKLQVEPFEEQAGPVALKRTCDVNDLECKRAAPGLSYGFTLRGQTVVDGEHRYQYFDQGKVTRAPAAAK